MEMKLKRKRPVNQLIQLSALC